MKYEIAIPSYKRSETVKTKTLKLLEKYNIPHEIVTIFVGNDEEKMIYEKALKDSPYQQIVVGQVGMGAIRNFISNYYSENTKVMHFDDDLSEILKKIDDKVMKPVDNLEEEVIFRGFEECRKNNSYIFGIYAASNPMFMKHRVAVGLYYCIGSLWGNIIRHDKDLLVTLDDKEDFERSLQYYVKDRVVVRLDDITVKSKYYTEQGGMQVERTTERIYNSAKILADRYPELCTMYIRKTTGHAELRLRDTSGAVKSVGGSTLDAFF